MNPEQTIPTQEEQMQQLQNEISNLQHQLGQANHNLNIANQAYTTLSNRNENQNNSLKIGRPDKFDGKYARSWVKSLDNVFAWHHTGLSEDAKLKYAVSYLTGAGLQWWELVTLNNTEIHTFNDFKTKLLEHFEPINRELNARKMLSELKQMGKFNTVRNYNQEFSRWLLQVPSMTPAEAIFHYSQGLKHRTRVEVERSEPNNLQEAMQIADRMDNLLAPRFGGGFHGGNGMPSDGPVPMQIGNMNTQRSNNRLHPAEKKRRIENNLCFVCGQKNCYARKHYNNYGNFGNRRYYKGNRPGVTQQSKDPKQNSEAKK